MPESGRILKYDVGTMTTNSTGSASYYTVHSINGRIYKVAALANASGTLTITESGINDLILTVAVPSGTNYSVYYPRYEICGTGGAVIAAGSGNVWAEVATDTVLRVQHNAGSATAGLSFQNVKIYYF